MEEKMGTPEILWTIKIYFKKEKKDSPEEKGYNALLARPVETWDHRVLSLNRTHGGTVSLLLCPSVHTNYKYLS